MSDKVTFCGIECEPCLGIGETTRQTKSLDGTTITHSKNIVTNLVIGGTTIPLRNRVRSFILENDRGWDRDYQAVIIDLQAYEHDCYTQSSLWKLSVSENAIWTDSSIYILDTEHNNAFWQEVEYKCSFSGSSKEKTGFHHPSWEASKLRIDTVGYDITRTWKLMTNGVVETVFSETYTKPMYSPDHPLFFVYPMPMSGETTDPDFGPVGEVWGGVPCKGYSFLDYRTGGLGPSEAEIKSGGQDYYYPEYLWYMGDHREEDQAEAIERFNDTYGSITNVKDKEVRNLPLPHIWGPEDPRGSIVRDFNGNTFASVMVTKNNGTKLWFNRLNGVDPNLKIVDEAITVNGEPLTSGGSGVGFSEVIRSYFPIGLMGNQNG